MANQIITSNTVSVVVPFGFTGSLLNKTFGEMFRTFSIYNTSGTCTVTMPNGNVMIIPQRVTAKWDAGSQSNKLNRLKRNTFTVTADDCVIVATI